jgi:hypothetical protein
MYRLGLRKQKVRSADFSKRIVSFLEIVVASVETEFGFFEVRVVGMFGMPLKFSGRVR